ncbi:8767_t:CDS:2 [Scutellospora calospora]|uniref:8767_t:CDS:1 n=1 Tax=Scutellospora calospora TaxID=85575 RepID=A0ACA9JYY9_9GLOM|nr:8767_t:CDS:2 [Scutellospora calospora]
MSDLGYAKYYKAYSKTICSICNELIYSDTRICSSHSEIYKKAWHEESKSSWTSLSVFSLYGGSSSTPLSLKPRPSYAW